MDEREIEYFLLAHFEHDKLTEYKPLKYATTVFVMVQSGSSADSSKDSKSHAAIIPPKDFGCYLNTFSNRYGLKTKEYGKDLYNSIWDFCILPHPRKEIKKGKYDI